MNSTMDDFVFGGTYVSPACNHRSLTLFSTNNRSTAPVEISPEKVDAQVRSWVENENCWRPFLLDVEKEYWKRKGQNLSIQKLIGINESETRGVLHLPDNSSFTASHVKFLCDRILKDDSLKKRFEGLSVKVTDLREADLKELSYLLQNDVTQKPLFPNFKKLILWRDGADFLANVIDWSREGFPLEKY